MLINQHLQHVLWDEHELVSVVFAASAQEVRMATCDYSILMLPTSIC